MNKTHCACEKCVREWLQALSPLEVHNVLAYVQQELVRLGAPRYTVPHGATADDIVQAVAAGEKWIQDQQGRAPQ